MCGGGLQGERKKGSETKVAWKLGPIPRPKLISGVEADPSRLSIAGLGRKSVMFDTNYGTIGRNNEKVNSVL